MILGRKMKLAGIDKIQSDNMNCGFHDSIHNRSNKVILTIPSDASLRQYLQQTTLIIKKSQVKSFTFFKNSSL